ncbi:MAG TPA: hypothetical protein V6C85_19625 [Allocoleopsis sp.]
MTSDQCAQKWYEKKWFIIPGFVLFLPLGLILAGLGSWVVEHPLTQEPLLDVAPLPKDEFSNRS